MARIYVIHWKAAEAGPLIEAFTAAGHEAELADTADAMQMGRTIKAKPPDLVAIDSTRLPGHGRQFARWLGETKKTSAIPVLFVPEDLRGQKLKRAVTQTIRDWVPPERVEKISTKTVAEKLGLKSGEEAGVVNEPRDCAALALFPNAPLETGAGIQPVVLWFVEDGMSLMSGMAQMRQVAARTRLWLAWRKGQKEFNENTIRAAALDAGLVDYKICALDTRWSACAFAVRKER